MSAVARGSIGVGVVLSTDKVVIAEAAGAHPSIAADGFSAKLRSSQMDVVWTSSSIRLAENDSLTHYVHWSAKDGYSLRGFHRRIDSRSEDKPATVPSTNLLMSGDLNPVIDDIAAALRTIDERCAVGKVVVANSLTRVTQANTYWPHHREPPCHDLKAWPQAPKCC